MKRLHWKDFYALHDNIEEIKIKEYIEGNHNKGPNIMRRIWYGAKWTGK